MDDRTIQVRWSGSAWRTERNYPLALGEVENPITVLQAGDLIYYDEPRLDLYKIGVAYGRAAWRDFAGDLAGRSRRPPERRPGGASRRSASGSSSTARSASDPAGD